MTAKGAKINFMDSLIRLCGIGNAKAGALFLMLLFSACSTLQEKKLVENGLTLRYLPVNSMKIDTDKLQLHHPLQITETDVRKHLQTFWYEGLYLLGKKERVFSDAEVDKTARLLTKALNQASPNNIVRFELATPRGATDVEVFSEGDRIHWRFKSIKGLVFTCEISLSACLGINWRLIPRDGQYYFSSEKMFGKRNTENWIVSGINPSAHKPNNQTSDAKKPSVPESGPAVEKEADTTNKKADATQKPGLEEKLFLLKQLYDKGLILEDEYRRKQKELMDEYLR